MGYKYFNSKKLVRDELINSKINKQKRIKFLIEKTSPNSEWFYLDETFLHKNYVRYKILQPLNNSMKIRFKMSIGTMVSIINCMSNNGLLNNSELISINKEINSDIFKQWLKTKLLPPNSVVVFDNASTHSRQYSKSPTQCSTVKTIKNWLTNNKINFNINAKKQELLNIVKENTFNKNYSVDEIIRSFGNIPLRLPTYHCDLNPIELVWAQLKKLIEKYISLII
jgi:transposase